MPRILISASFPESLLARQTPAARGEWEEFEFIFAATEDAVDAWVVYDNLREPQTQRCPVNNTLLITGEPASVRRYRSRFTGQFHRVWTSQADLKHPRVTHRNEAQHWHYGMRASRVHGQPLNFDQLSPMPRPEKTKLMSVICSDKAVTEDHRRRLDFVRLLQQRFGDSIDFLGRGFCPVEDKADAIFEYKYHLVLENDHSDFFMTEKLSDAFLGWSYPIYFGGSEAYHRFPLGSFTSVDIYQPEQALAIIADVMTGETYEQSQSQIAAARQAVLGRNNLFAMLADYWREHLQSGAVERVTLLPKQHRGGLVWRQVSRLAQRPFTRRAA